MKPSIKKLIERIGVVGIEVNCEDPGYDSDTFEGKISIDRDFSDCTLMCEVKAEKYVKFNGETTFSPGYQTTVGSKVEVNMLDIFDIVGNEILYTKEEYIDLMQAICENTKVL